MAKTGQDKISKIDEQIAQLTNRRKQEIQKQNERNRKARNHRLCKRHGLLEDVMPELIEITDDQFKAFVEKAVANSYGRDILARIVAQGADKNASEEANTTANPTTPKSAETPPQATDTPSATQAKSPTPNGKTTTQKPAEAAKQPTTPANTKPNPPPSSQQAPPNKSNGGNGNGRNQQPPANKKGNGEGGGT